VHPRPDIDLWAVDAVTAHHGGRVVVPREHAPLGRQLPYCRAAGQRPAPSGVTENVLRHGWSVLLGDRGLGDTLLALGLVRAVIDGSGHEGEAHYRGPRPRLMQRCRLALTTDFADGPHIVESRSSGDGATFRAIPEGPPTWLDLLDDRHVEVHAALPMRYYLDVEQRLGVRLPADRSPLPTFASAAQARPFHVVFITATSWADRKDYGTDGFLRVAQLLATRRTAPWSFTLITGYKLRTRPRADIEILAGLDAVECLDVFASADVVIGNDTGLTHLAALTERPDGTGPQVIGLYGRHAHTKWTTGHSRHHAIATPFSKMLAAADRCPVRDQIDDALWSDAGLSQVPAELIADFAGRVVGWW
jgi:hypothetical protein